jgi:hypothetical protein
MDILCDAIGFTETSTGPEHPNTIDQRRSVSSVPSVPSGPQSTSPQGSSRKCHICGRSYERADHLNRHLKSHENARSHKCTRCKKSFNRADLLNRHEAGHDRPQTERRSIERGNRVAAACLACVQARTKCQDQKPCIRCLRRKIPCETSDNDTQLNDGSATSNLQSTWDGQAMSELIETQEHGRLSKFADGQNTAGVPSLYDSNSISRDAVLNPALAIQSGSSDNMQYGMQPSGSPYYNEPPPSSSLLTSFLGHQHITSLPGERQFGNTYFSQDLDFGMWDFDVDSVELGLGDYNPSSGGNDMHQTPNSSSHPPKDASKRYAAFERSPWLWTPTKSDQALNDQHDLDVDEDNIPSVLTPASPASSIDEFTKCCIHQKERDKLLSIMFTLQKTTSNPPLLPSLALLNNIIHVYFVQESFKVDQLIHVGTFEPSKVLPHLLLAIVSAGSSLISTPAIWKMGLALQEVVRHTVAEYVRLYCGKGQVSC